MFARIRTESTILPLYVKTRVRKNPYCDIFQAAINIEVFQAGNVITRKPCVSFKNLLLIWGVLYYKKGRDLLRFTSISLIDTITIDHWSHYSWLMTQPLHVSTTKWHILHTVHLCGNELCWKQTTTRAHENLTILTGKTTFDWIKRIYWNRSLAASDLFPMLQLISMHSIATYWAIQMFEKIWFIK